MLEPLERFETIRRRAARLGSRLADLAYANPYEGVREGVRAALGDALDDERTLDLQYTPFGGATLARRAVADALAESHELDFGFRDVVLTPGAMAALQIALRTSGEEGDEAVIPVPCWLDYPLYARFNGHTPALVPLRADDFDLDLGAIEGALGPRTSVVLISNPSNPAGRRCSGTALAELGAALRRAEERFGRPITLIADETHRDFSEPGDFESAASHYERTLIVYSFGKYHFLQGQRLGYVAVSPRHPERDRVADELVAWTRITGIATPTSLMQRALPRLLELRHDQSGVATWRRRVVETLSAQGYEVVPPNATLFVYVRTPRADDFAFVEMLARDGVLVLPAPVFHHQGHFRLALTGSPEMLERALPVLGSHAGG